MFEESLIYRAIRDSGFPFIVRLDRSVYKKQDHVIDPALISRRIVFASIAGYFVGKKLGNRETLLFFGFGGAVLLWHLVDDLRLKKEGKYQDLYTIPLFPWEDHSTVNQIARSKTQKVIGSTQPFFKLKPSVRNLEVTGINKLVDRLPREYFK